MPTAWWNSTGHAAKIPGVTIALHRCLTDRHLLSHTHTHTQSNLETTTRAEKTGQVLTVLFPPLTFLEPSKMSTCCSARRWLSAYHSWWESRHSDGHIYPVVSTSHWLDDVHMKSKDPPINRMDGKPERIHLPEQGGNVCFKHTFFFFFFLLLSLTCPAFGRAHTQLRCFACCSHRLTDMSVFPWLAAAAQFVSGGIDTTGVLVATKRLQLPFLSAWLIMPCWVPAVKLAFPTMMFF